MFVIELEYISLLPIGLNDEIRRVDCAFTMTNPVEVFISKIVDDISANVSKY